MFLSNTRFMAGKHQNYEFTFDLSKGGFYSEGTDAIVISSKRRTLLFSWALILNLWYLKGLKICQITAWCRFEGSNSSKMKPYLNLQIHFRSLYIWHDLSPDLKFSGLIVRDLRICNTKITPILFVSGHSLLYFEFSWTCWNNAELKFQII